MTYITASSLTRDQHDAFLKWLEAEGIDPAEVHDNGRFSVHNGWISGDKFLFDSLDTFVVRNGKPVLVHFTQVQKNPLPEELHA